MVLREISKTTDASVILPVFSQYARTFLRKSNEYAINTLYHKCTTFVSFYYNELVLETLRKARKANTEATPLIHSDRGSQYTSKDYYRLTTQYQMTRSMSRVGKCIDNAPIESFFGHFKTECYDLKKYKTFEELVSDIDAYIYFYNHQRFQERNNGLAPLEMRNKAVA